MARPEKNFLSIYSEKYRGAQAPDHLATYIPLRRDRMKRDVLRTSPFETWKQGIEPLLADGLAKIISDREGYVTFTHMKTKVNTPYDMLVTCVPHEGSPIVHSLDEFSETVRGDIFDGVNTALLAITNVAARHDQPLKRMYALQHIGVDELHQRPYSTTFPQLHMHLYAVTDNDTAQAVSGLTHSEFVKQDRGERHGFFDPTIVIARDLFAANFGPETLDERTSSLILAQRALDVAIPTGEQELYAQTMTRWKKLRQEAASCFTDFEKDAHGRMVPKERTARVADVEGFIQAHPELSDDSQIILRHLATNLVAYREEDMWSALSNNVQGSMGWTFDYDNLTTTLRLAPRNFVGGKIGATDGYFSCRVGDQAERIDTARKDHTLAVQRELFAEVGKLL